MRSSLKKGTNMKSKIRQMANVELTQEHLNRFKFEKFRTSMSDCSLAGLINWHELCNCMLNPLFAGDAFPSNNHYCQRIWHTQWTIYFLSDNFIRLLVLYRVSWSEIGCPKNWENSNLQLLKICVKIISLPKTRSRRILALKKNCRNKLFF